MSLSALQSDCIRDYRKYADTVAILSAIYDLLQKYPDMARFVGIETRLEKNNRKYVTPDLVAVYDNDTKGLIFEIKWSMPSDMDLLEKEIRELKKYFDDFSNWKIPKRRVDYQDIVLVCHLDDVKRIVDAIQKISKEPDYGFLNNYGFAVWSWTINPSKQGERKEELRLFSVYGRKRNENIEKLLHEPGGILISEDVLTYLRFKFFFVRQKPPIQYTMTVLIQHIFIAFQPSIEFSFYDVDTDLIYERARIFFPAWHEYGVDTIQLKKRWIKESLDFLSRLGLIEKGGKSDWWKVPIPILKSRQQTQSALCKKIANLAMKQRTRKRPGRIRIKTIIRPKRKRGPLNDFLKSSCSR